MNLYYLKVILSLVPLKAAAYWFTEHKQAACKNQCDETIQQSLALQDSNPLHQ